ncbi:DUF4136 domain-containing protein [Thiomonas sp. FB-6]|uniref:DUF4136 domain-containing protein n=1 Tax=Thiomonas sp. FB-6 TaxID=1158291 RepID=UPI00039A45D0|nr:DUF4136 domain-containing protein [Thiomonas sp. FB-6]
MNPSLSTPGPARGAAYSLRALLLLGALALLGLLGGCASLNVNAYHVDTPKPAPQALVGAHVQLQAAPADAEGPQAEALRTAVLDAMTRAGMVPLLGSPAPYTARYAFRVYVDFEASFPSAWPPPGPPILLPDGAWIYNGYPWWYHGWSWPPPWYERVFEVEIRDAASGALVWRSSAVIGGYDQRIGPVAAQLAAAAFADFPQGSGRRLVRDPQPAR